MTQNIYFKEGLFTSNSILTELGDLIDNIDLGSETSNWETFFALDPSYWVEYNKVSTAGKQGVYKHTDGKTYSVKRITSDFTQSLRTDNTVYITYNADKGGFVEEYGSGGDTKTGFTLPISSFTTTNLITGDTESFTIAGCLMVILQETDQPKKAILVRQIREELDGTFTTRADWNEFQYICDLPASWQTFIRRTDNLYLKASPTEYAGSQVTLTMYSNYTFTETSYTAKPVSVATSSPGYLCTKYSPTPPNGEDQKVFYTLFYQELGNYTHLKVRHGQGFMGTPSSGNPASTYNLACDVSTVKFGSTPKVINQLQAEKAFDDFSSGTFSPPIIKFESEVDGTEIISPTSMLFYGRNITPYSGTSYIPRKAYMTVNYSASITNDRICLILEGDPTPDFEGFYRNFMYLGRIKPFDEDDYVGNYAFTCGLGDLSSNLTITGFQKSSFDPSLNPEYYAWGTGTSNGMTSISMFKSKGLLPFQSYYPSFLTQLPSYKDINWNDDPNFQNVEAQNDYVYSSKGLKRLIVEKSGFQSSKWTNYYHASPCYVVHPYEGYRGYLDGVVAIHRNNIINGDELIVDSEIPKDPNDPSKGNYQEVYKYCSIRTPNNFLQASAGAKDFTLAFLKEIR